MTVYQYNKSGELINKETKIKPTQEMQEVIDDLWNTVDSLTVVSTVYTKNLLVEKHV